MEHITKEENTEEKTLMLSGKKDKKNYKDIKIKQYE